MATVVVAATLAFGFQPSPLAQGAAKNLVDNGTFSGGVTGWKVNDATTTKLSTKKVSGNQAARLTSTVKGSTLVLNDAVNSVQSGDADLVYTATARVKSSVKKRNFELRVREVYADQVLSHSTTYTTKNKSWHKLSLTFTTTIQGAALDLNVLAYDVAKSALVYVDSVSLTVTGTAQKNEAAETPTPSPTATATATATASTPATTSGAYTLSNGCTLNARGIGTCDPLVGGAVGSNSDPTSIETSAGTHFSVRRTYYQSTQVEAAMRNAAIDLAAGRIPWISFKLPYNWTDMVAGKGDAWATDIAQRIAKLNGPVWVAFHHEPEKDETDITKWTKMQERLGPIIRSNAPNAGFSVILTGWNQLYGASEFRFDSIWPNTTVDIAGFDIYTYYGTTKNGTLKLGDPSLKATYLDKISAWAKSKGVAWGLAETGLNDRASADYPHWIRDTYSELKATGGLALAYFNTTLNSTTNWALSTTTKMSDFTDTLKQAPTFPKR